MMHLFFHYAEGGKAICKERHDHPGHDHRQVKMTQLNIIHII